jgi:hydroxyacylglutathione hydrolase
MSDGQSTPHAGVAPGIWRITNRTFRSNTYLCRLEHDRDCVIIDPGTDPAMTDHALTVLGLVPRHVVLTHGHFDHAGSASYFQDRFGVRVFMHPADRKTLSMSNFLLMAFKVPFTMTMPTVHPLDEVAAATDGQVSWLAAPGHTPGSAIVRCRDAHFTGDTMYCNGVGLSKLPGEDHDVLRTTLRGLWDTIDPGATIHPGHGPSAEFGQVRRSNEALVRFIEGHDVALSAELP